MLINGKRSLAHIEKVTNIRSIEGADNIEQVYVLGWNIIVKKGEFKEGDKCVYIEIDSRVPDTDPRFEFLSKKGYKIKTMKLGKFGVISQGIIFPISDFPEIEKYNVGEDVTDILKISKIETEEEKRLKAEANKQSGSAFVRARMKHKKLFSSKFIKYLCKYRFWRNLLGKLFGGKTTKPKQFPDWIVKTDEERIENIPQMLSYKEPLIATEKIDGTSTTFAIKFTNKSKTKHEVFICSRNVRMETDTQSCYFDSNVYWDMWNILKIEDKMVEYAKKNDYDYFIIQGETWGTKLQGNPYKSEKINFNAYNMIYGYFEDSAVFKTVITNPELLKLGKRVGPSVQFKVNSVSAAKIAKEEFGIDWVPILDTNFILPDSMEEMKKLATGNSVVNTNALREGIVYRSETDPSISFKNVSREYLLKHNQ